MNSSLGPTPNIEKKKKNPVARIQAALLSDHSFSGKYLIALTQRSAAKSILATDRRLKIPVAATPCNYAMLSTSVHHLELGTDLLYQNSSPLDLGVQQCNF